MNQQAQSIIKSLAEMAWADGEISPEERALLFNVMVSMGADPEDMDEMGSVLGRPGAGVEEAPLSEVIPDMPSRLNVMRALLTMSFVDGILSFAELTLIEKLAKDLEIDRDQLEEIRQEAVVAAKQVVPDVD